MKNPKWKFLVLFSLFVSLAVTGTSRAGSNKNASSLSSYLPLLNRNYSMLTLSFIRIDLNDIYKQYLYKINADGSGLQSLTIDPMYMSNNRWSPHGSKIAFQAFVNNNFDIFVINADGTGLVNLTNNPAYDYDPTWSNDGTQIAFISDRGGTSQVYVMSSDGSNVTQITNLGAGCTIPIWSPVGNKIAFDTLGGGYNAEEIYVINADGSGLLRLSNNSYFDNIQGWSPDGTKILFRSNRDLVQTEDLYFISPDGSGLARLATFGDVVTAGWSPNGEWIAVGSSNSSLYIIDPDGSYLILMQCQSELVYTYDLAWSPDSARIAYSPIYGSMGETRGIFVLNIDGSACRQLTNLRDESLQWRP